MTYTPTLSVTWYGGLTWADGSVYYGSFNVDSLLPRYADTDPTDGDFLYGPVSPADGHYHNYYGGDAPHHEDEFWCYATYGDPADTGAFPPPANTDYHLYGDTDCLVYGAWGETGASPLVVDPEDPRAIICEVHPTRINHCKDPNFVKNLDRGAGSWHTDGVVVMTEDIDAPYASTGVLMSSGASAQYGGFGNLEDAIFVGTVDLLGGGGQDIPAAEAEKNLWKISFSTNARHGVFGGFKILRANGVFEIYVGHTVPVARPWERSPFDPEDTTETNQTPYSSTDWYVYYDLIDLKSDALWAIPLVGMMPDDVVGGVPKDDALITSVSAERWNENWTTKGTPIPEIIPGDPRLGESSLSWLEMDPLIFFDGSSGTVAVNDDYIWMGIPNKSVSGYYPQRLNRTQGMRTLMKSWIPVGRSLSIRYIYERP